MPVRKRRRRSHRDELSLERFVVLSIGPMPGVSVEDLPIDLLERAFRRHRRRLASGSWAERWFDDGGDDRDGDQDAVRAQDGLSGEALAAAVGLPGASRG